MNSHLGPVGREDRQDNGKTDEHGWALHENVHTHAWQKSLSLSLVYRSYRTAWESDEKETRLDSSSSPRWQWPSDSRSISPSPSPAIAFDQTQVGLPHGTNADQLFKTLRRQRNWGPVTQPSDITCLSHETRKVPPSGLSLGTGLDNHVARICLKLRDTDPEGFVVNKTGKPESDTEFLNTGRGHPSLLRS